MTQITSEVLLVADLFTKGRFAVPWHQRYYDWTEEQVGELLLDLKEAIDENRASYFLGSIMLVDSDGVWQINDGQQRLITLSLVIAALCRRFAAQRELDSPREQRALRLLFDRSEGAMTNLDDTMRDTPRITPPRQDRSRFTQLIRGHDIGTNGKLTSAWNTIEVHVFGLTLDQARRSFDFLTDKVEIGVLYVPVSEDANAVFEALNGRGKQLDDVDLIRNHLYSYFTGPGDDERRQTVHSNLESVLPNIRTARRQQEYFRCYFQCRFGYLKKTRFYRETRAKIQSSSRGCTASDYAYGLVRELAEPSFVELFRTITASNPDPEFLAAFGRASRTTTNKRRLLDILSELRGYRVAQPLVFAFLRKFVEVQNATQEDKRRVAHTIYRNLSDLASFVIRVSFCEAKFEPSRYETAFANCAMRIASATSPADLEIQTDLRECDERSIMDDTRFASQLAVVEMKDPRRAKRLLFGINAAREREARALDFSGCSVEHVLPQSEIYWQGWSGFSSSVGSDTKRWVYRIGNLTLLGDSDNFARRQFNANFAAKREAFKASPFAITRDLSPICEWNPETITSRSEELAQAASQVWSFYRSLGNV